jgi:signal transduction histidine kinase
MVCAGFRSNIQLKRDLAAGLWTIHASPSQMRQVLVNLITNACEAIGDEGGTLTVRTRNVHRKAWVCTRHRQHAAGDYVELKVQDTGCGIDERVQKRLFEVFFSTKFMGRGLGLAVASTIVREHEGCIEIESQPSQGTIVSVYIPRA